MILPTLFCGETPDAQDDTYYLAPELNPNLNKKLTLRQHLMVALEAHAKLPPKTVRGCLSPGYHGYGIDGVVWVRVYLCVKNNTYLRYDHCPIRRATEEEISAWRYIESLPKEPLYDTYWFKHSSPIFKSR